jgi:hypothetical protein
MLVVAVLSFIVWGYRAAHAQNFQADSALSVTSVQVANNTTAIQICAKNCRLYQVDAFSNGTALAYVKLYNASSATCGSGTPQWRGMIPFGLSSAGGGFLTPFVNGDSYSNGLALCVTGGFADADTTAPAASTFIVNIHFKLVP